MGRPASGTRDATKGLSGGAGTDEEEKLVGCRSHCHHRCGDCCGHAAVKSGWRAMRGRYTEEQGRLLGNGRCPESGDKKTTALPQDAPCSCLTYRAGVPARPAGLATWLTRLRFVDIEGLYFAPCLVVIIPCMSPSGAGVDPTSPEPHPRPCPHTSPPSSGSNRS